MFLDGADITDPRVDPDRVRRRIGIVFQSYNLFPHLTVLENVTLAPRRVHKRPRGLAESEAMALLTRVGLGDKARRPIRTGSPAGSSSGWRSCGRWSTPRGCCCWTR